MDVPSTSSAPARPAPNALQRALGGLAGAVMSNVQQFQGNLHRSMQQLGAQAGAAVQQMQDHVAQHLQKASGTQAQPLLASVSGRLAAAASTLSRSAAQPVVDLAFNPEELKFRLQGVPVYTVVNSDDQFVLVTGEDKRQLGLFFFKESDAQEMIETIKGQNPKLGKQARVITTTMDRVYEFATTPREALEGLDEGVLFRFVPDAAQVEKALKLYHQAGVDAAGFAGVPLFQAEGLTVKSEERRYTPLFFSKDDLDCALGGAHVAKDNELQADTRSKVDRARAELQAAEAELAAAPDRERKAAQKKAEAAAKRVERYEQRLEELQSTTAKKLPRVDVGSLEEVIAKMELDEKGEWGDVMFIAPGTLVVDGPEAAAAAKQQAAEKKGSNKKK